MDIKVVGTCPLGHTCEKIVGDTIERCMWYVALKGTDAQGVDHDEWNCAIAWSPILQIEMAGTNRGQTAAIESLRNEQDKRQGQAVQELRRIDVRNT